MVRVDKTSEEGENEMSINRSVRKTAIPLTLKSVRCQPKARHTQPYLVTSAKKPMKLASSTAPACGSVNLRSL